PRHRDGASVDVARQHGAAQRPRRRDRQHARTRSDVEDARAGREAPQDSIESGQASARGAVMTGAEGERGLDLDADAVAAQPRAMVPAMDEKTSGCDRREAIE